MNANDYAKLMAEKGIISSANTLETERFILLHFEERLKETAALREENNNIIARTTETIKEFSEEIERLKDENKDLKILLDNPKYKPRGGF